MEINPIILAIPVYFILIGIEVVYDWVKKKNIYRFNDALTNISCGMFEQITGVFVKVATIAVYHYFFTQFALFEIPQTWYWAVLLFVLVDFFYYWAHRLDHEVNILWLGHSVHHQSEDYNFSVALRQGAFQKIFNVVFMLPLAIIGFETEWFLYIGAFGTLYQFWIHTEAVDKLPRWFEFVFNTPSHHRVHHGRNPKYVDRNHGGTFIIFDRIFGTFQKEEERPTYGVTTPTATFDPLNAHLKPWKALWRQLASVPGVKNKLKLLIMPPGWMPDSLGGSVLPTEVDLATYKKYSLNISNQWNYYIFFQYALMLAGAAFFLFNFNQFEWKDSILFASLLVVSLVSIGRIFEQKTWGFWLEMARLLTVSLVLLSLYSFERYLQIILLVGCLLSLVWVVINYKNTIEIKSLANKRETTE